jgi:hypothetical protein
MKYYFIFSILLFFSISCTTQKEVALLKILKKQYQLPQKSVVLLIPNAGCSGCISDAEYFAKKHLNYSKLFVGIVGMRSKKLAIQKLGQEFLFSSKVKIDVDGEVKQCAKVSSYPKIVYIEQNQITKIVEASPEAKGDVWAELKTYLLNEK